MSIICGLPLLECVYCLACARWAWKRCLHTAGHDSETWDLATAEEFEPVPRLCRYILAVYEDDIRKPLWEPPGGYGIDPYCLVMKKSYEDTQGQAPPYLLYLDHDHADIVLAIRGLNLAKESDYALLLDNKLGKRKFEGGYVHNGLLKAAGCVLNAECDRLRELVKKYLNYTLTLSGHSLGSGVAALLTMVVVQNLDRLGNIDRKRVRCFAIAPARCMSLNLAVRYADVINSVILQREAERALELMREKDEALEIPAKQRMERQETLDKEHNEELKAALCRAVTLAVPHAFSLSEYGTFDEEDSHTSVTDSSMGSSTRRKGVESWDELIERLFERDDWSHVTQETTA